MTRRCNMCDNKIDKCENCGDKFGKENEQIFCYTDDIDNIERHFCSTSCFENWLIVKENDNLWEAMVVIENE